jgi:histidyl-tRNA synthetase
VSEQDEKAAKRKQWEEHNRAKALAAQQEDDAPNQVKAVPVAPRKQFQAIKGTRDLLPPDTALWNHVEQTAHKIFGTFGFGEIRVPIFEPTELFARSIGADTDVVGKEMYTFEDRQGQELSDLLDSITFVNAQNSPIRMQKFLSDISAAMESGEIEKTDENRNAISAIRSISKELFAIPEPSEEGSEEEVMDKMLEYFGKRKPFENQLLGSWLQLQRKYSISLRPEATASVCRAYIEHSMQQLPQPVKLYYTGPMFRRERPQKGRYRQFYQIGAEVLGGNDAPAIDAELIEMLMTFFDKLELKGIELDINSIGHNAPNCRPAYVEKLRAALREVKDQLGADSQRRVDTNPLRVLDSKLESEQSVIATLPKIADHLCDECKTHYAAVKQQLELRGVIYRENWRLVRGLDYYMRTTFEITARGLGSQNAVCGGGRYDGLVELLGGPPTKGIGFAIGEDRLILSLQEQARHSEAAVAAGEKSSRQSPATSRQSLSVYIAWMGQNTYATAVRAAKDLRRAGFSVELPPTELKFGKALSHADKLGATFALILGENEVSEGLWTLKTLADGTQQKLAEPAIIEHLRNSLL